MSNGIGRVWAVNAEGGDEGRPNGVGPVWIENADQLGSKLPEPEAGDAGKVLGVLNSDGDIGWVIDQSGTFTQVQADWDQDDSSQVSYIANKPSLATVATTGAYADLSGTPTIPTVDQEYNAASANAQSGVAVAGAISGKQDTINDLETIRSGAAAGATAVQPGSLATVATTGSYADLSNKPTIPAAQVNADWNSSSGVSEILNKPTLATVATSGSYADLSNKPTIPSVDQNYSASSANAQSGTAVAQAIASIPSASYTAGDGINITSNEVSVKAGTGLEIADVSTTGTTTNLESQDIFPATWTSSGYYAASIAPLTSNLLSKMSNGLDVTLVGNFWSDPVSARGFAALYTIEDSRVGDRLVLGSYLNSTASGTVITFDTGNIDTAQSTVTLSQVESDIYSYRLGILLNEGLSMTAAPMELSQYEQSVTTATYVPVTTVHDALCVADPLPASTSADEDKVLTVNSSGNPVWAAAQGGSSYTGGTGINIDGNNHISVNPDSTLKGVYNDWSYTVTALTNAGTNYPSYIDVHSQEELEYVLNSFPVDSSIKVSVQTGDGIYNDAVPQSADIKAYLIVSSDTNFNSFYVNHVEMSVSYDTTNHRWVLEPQTVEAVTPAPTHGWVPVGTPSGTLRYVSFAFGTSISSLTPSTVARQDTLISETITIDYPGYTDPMKIGVATPLPAPAVGDWDKVLKVSPSLNAEWATLALGSVTSIQQVNSLPASPDANTLYLIPEA